MSDEIQNDEPQVAERYPLDFDALSKGDEISAERCEKLFKLTRFDIKYSLRLLNLKQQIERELAVRGKPVTTCCRNGAIVILLDHEASEYNQHEQTIAVSKLARAQFRNCVVDIGNLTEEQKVEHQRRLIVGGAQVAALREVRKIALKTTVRDRPKLE